MAKDFRNKKFQKVLRGYADAEVDTYIAYINEEYHKLERAKSDSDRKLALALQKIDAMNSTIEEQSRDLTELTGIVPERAAAMKQAEDERKRQAEEAEQNRAQAENLLREAEERLAQAEQIRQEAVERAEQILNAAHAEAAAAKAEEEKALRTAKYLYGEVCSFRDSLFEIYNTHIESVEGIAAKAEDFLGLTDADPAETPEPETETEADDESEEDFEELPEDEEPEETGEYADESDESEGSEESDDSEEPDESDEDEIPEEYESAEEDGPALFEPDMSLFTPEPKRTESGDLFIDLEDGDGFTELTDEEEAPETEEEAPEYADESSESAEEEAEYPDAEPVSAEPAPEEEPSPAEAEEPELRPAEPEAAETAETAETAADEAERGDFRQDEEEDESQSYTISELLRKNRGGAEREKKSDYADLDDLLSKGNGSASDDEFNRVYGGDSSKRVDEIRRQPTVTPEEPKNPKKHKKF